MLFFIPKTLMAINIHGLYISSCQRELGVIIKVEKSKIKLLTLKGEFKEIPRHEIVYFTYYSIDSFPDVEISPNNLEKAVQIDTIQNNQIVKFVEGWPIDYSENDISFLTLEGHEVLVARDNIWRIKIKPLEETLIFKNKNPNNYEFVHPYLFRFCPTLRAKNQMEPAMKVYPQQMLNDSVRIKLELDRLQAGRERLDKYYAYQQFYAVPHIYRNLSSLGYWFSYGSRYGGSNSRNNNLTPILENQFSSGVFGYQHLLLTGSAPMPYSIHEETQTQMYYKFKADYLHLGIMLDPNVFLLTEEKYEWKESDLKKIDDGVNPIYGVELGFDYNAFSLQIYADGLNMGINSQQFGYYGPAISFRLGCSYQNHLFKAEFQYDPFVFNQDNYYDCTDDGDSKSGLVSDYMELENQVGLFRFNFSTPYFKNIDLRYSFIYRKINLKNSYQGYTFNDNYNFPDNIRDNIFQYTSHSFSNALYLIYFFKKKYSLGTFVALEYHKATSKTFGQEGKTQETDKNFYPKFGLHASLFF